jgi:predicted phage terminase large subunit-like protein
MWNGFADDILSRRAPVCIFIILATPRHVDDLFGRIKKRMADDVHFPRFKEVKFPARSTTYQSGYLFPERFSEQYYLEQYATLSQNSAAAMLDCDPQVRGGNMIRVDGIKIVNPKEWAAKTNNFFWTRGWDLASTEKQCMKDDPDYTVGIKSAVRKIDNEPLWFVDDVKLCRWEAGRRNQIIVETAMLDGDTVLIGVEAVAGYKDAYTQVRDALQGRRTVQRIALSGDKVAKAIRLEPIFERGNVYIKQAPWNQEFIKQFSDFPAGAHDDIVDSGVVSYSMHQNLIISGRI